MHGPVPLPPERTMESRVSTLAGEDKDMFLSFLEGVLAWLPEDRLIASQAYFHPWLRGPEVLKYLEEKAAAATDASGGPPGN